MNNQKCKVRPEIVNINSNEPVFFPFSIKTIKCSDSCNNINDPYTKMCVPHLVINLNIKVFNTISWTNETRHMKLHETYTCKCKLDPSVCNNKQRWNEEKCRCECKELIVLVYVRKDLFGILVIVNVNVINLVILVSI